MESKSLARLSAGRLARLGSMRDGNLSIRAAILNERVESGLRMLYATVSVFNLATSRLEFVSPDELKALKEKGKPLWVSVTVSFNENPTCKCSQVLLDWLEVFVAEFNLPALSLVDAVTPEADPVKVDRTKTCLYMSLAAFTSKKKDGLPVGEAHEVGISRRRGFSHRASDTEEIRLKSTVYQLEGPGWERVCLFLSENVLISFFEQGTVLQQLLPNLPTKADFQYGLGFLFYKITNEAIKLTPKVVRKYERMICEVESGVLDTRSRSTFQEDVYYTKELHLMRNELALMKHIVAPTQRVLNTILTEYGNGQSSLLGPEAVDYLEEVGDELGAMNEDMEVAIANCEQVTGLVFNLSTFFDAKNGSYLTLVATVFLPLTWVCGIYGMNFDRLPELHWHYGYLYFWLVSIAVAIGTALLVIIPQGLLRRAGVGLRARAGRAIGHEFGRRNTDDHVGTEVVVNQRLMDGSASGV